MIKRLHILIILLCLSIPAICRAQNDPPTWVSTVSYKTGDLVKYQFAGGGPSIFRCIADQTSNHPNPQTPTAWELHTADYSITILVQTMPNFTSFTTAWTYIKHAVLRNGAVVTIKLPPYYTQQYTDPQNLDHAYGSGISIVGDTGVRFQFNNSTDGFLLDTGHTLKKFSMIEIDGVNAAGTRAMRVSSNANLNADNVKVTLFAIAALATQGGRIEFGPGMDLTASTNVVQATNQGNLEFTSPGKITGYYGSEVGAACSYSSFIGLAGCTITHCGTGIICSYGCSGYAPNASLSNITGNALGADWNGMLYAPKCTFNTVGQAVYQAFGGLVRTQ